MGIRYLLGRRKIGKRKKTQNTKTERKEYWFAFHVRMLLFFFHGNAIKIVFPCSKSIRSNGEEKCYIMELNGWKQVLCAVYLLDVKLSPSSSCYSVIWISINLKVCGISLKAGGGGGFARNFSRRTQSTVSNSEFVLDN